MWGAAVGGKFGAGTPGPPPHLNTPFVVRVPEAALPSHFLPDGGMAATEVRSFHHLSHDSKFDSIPI